MKIGDKVRFLNEVGGGTVVGFQGKDVALIQDDNGFDIPTLIRDCVVIETDDYNIAKVHTVTPGGKAKSPSADASRGAKATSASHRAYEDEEDDKPITFVPQPLERREGERLNVYLAFVPADVKTLSETVFECYLVNDSNYFLSFSLLSAEGSNWRTRFQGTIEPNMKLFMEEFAHSQLGEIERIAVQLIAFKQNKSFLLKPALSVELRLDLTKFYKLHTFAPSDFFEDPALLYDVVRDDKPVRTVFMDAGQIKEALLAKEETKRAPEKPRRKEQRNEILEVDLHSGELLDSTRGMSNTDILNYQLDVFRRTMEEHKNRKGRKIVFIHGKGEGVLRNALIKELRTHYRNCLYQDASFREYGFGATMVIIK